MKIRQYLLAGLMLITPCLVVAADSPADVSHDDLHSLNDAKVAMASLGVT